MSKMIIAIFMVVFATAGLCGYVPVVHQVHRGHDSANVDVSRNVKGFSYSKQEYHPSPVKVVHVPVEHHVVPVHDVPHGYGHHQPYAHYN